MNILFLAHRMPFPPDKGDKIRSYHILKYLAGRHRVFAAFPLEDPDERQWIPILLENVHHVTFHPFSAAARRVSMLKSFLTGRPLSVGHFYSRALQREIRELVRRVPFDAVFAFSSSMAEYVWSLDIPLKIIDFCDLDSAKFAQYASQSEMPRSWLYRLESRRLARYEEKIASFFDDILFISERESRLFRPPKPRARIEIMSNGVDLEAFRWPASPQNGEFRVLRRPYLIFTGVMDYLPNVDAAAWFASHVMPILRKKNPGLGFYIVGRRPAKSIRRLHDPSSGIYVTGSVPDVRPYLREAQVFVAPLRIARGMQTKILEAMASSVPVVCSPDAAKGIGARHRHEVLTAETATGYAIQITRVLNDSHLRETLVRQARTLLKKNFDWEKNLSVLDRLFQPKKKMRQPPGPEGSRDKSGNYLATKPQRRKGKE